MSEVTIKIPASALEDVIKAEVTARVKKVLDTLKHISMTELSGILETGEIPDAPPPSLPIFSNGPRKNQILRTAPTKLLSKSEAKRVVSQKGVPSKHDVPSIAKAFLAAFGDLKELNGEDLRKALGYSKGQFNSLREQLRTRGVLKMKGQKRAAKWTLDTAKASVLAGHGQTNGAAIHA